MGYIDPHELIDVFTNSNNKDDDINLYDTFLSSKEYFDVSNVVCTEGIQTNSYAMKSKVILPDIHALKYGSVEIDGVENGVIALNDSGVMFSVVGEDLIRNARFKI